ncbi:hypothetical protein DM01DRAFT_1331072 [Hesseltinella vesiculosa]|uniref:CCD97-like C-terminal domain-containing protein n=1 Tax=Hesseltinella vesiculosa TaxID=101127 RepID=A0A1X2GY08_9FUNG|nr:hypothetical protein DM01DRAFT_1331072 [Hesseltinella vesiculosa]
MDPDHRHAILTYLEQHIQAIALSIPISDPQQKLDMLMQWLEVDPTFFYAQCGAHLPPSLRLHFQQPVIDPAGQPKLVQNRRLHYLLHHLRPNGYFTDEEDVRLREPGLYEEYISTRAVYPEDMIPVDRIIQDMNQRLAPDQWHQQPEEEDTDEDEDDGQSATDPIHNGKQVSTSLEVAMATDNSDGIGISDDGNDEERQWEEFVRLLEERWLDGLDDHFDYTQVDDNPEYDDLNQLTRDRHDDYFDAESPVGGNNDTGVQDF